MSLILPLHLGAPAARGLATPLFAFALSLGSSFLIYAIAKVKKARGTILLTGIAITFLFSSLKSAVHYLVSDQILRISTNWSDGNLVGATLE